VVQQNATATEEMSSTSEELAGQADQLKSAAAFFKVENATAQPLLTAGVSRAGRPSKAAPKPRRRGNGNGAGGDARDENADLAALGVAYKEASGSGVTLNLDDVDDSEFERY